MTVSTCIGILSVPGRYFFSKEYQYVFVNGRYITATRIHKEVYRTSDLMNALALSESIFIYY